jgi:hypothetical protein
MMARYGQDVSYGRRRLLQAMAVIGGSGLLTACTRALPTPTGRPSVATPALRTAAPTRTRRAVATRTLRPTSTPTEPVTPRATPEGEPTSEGRPEVWPLRWGVDDAGSRPYAWPYIKWGPEVLEAFRFDLILHHYLPLPSIAQNQQFIAAMDAWCDRYGVGWIANLEHANWIASFIDENDIDWFTRPDGRHFFLFPNEVLDALGDCRRLRGLMYDEAAHMQNCANCMAQGTDQPWVYDPAGDALEDAADRFASAVGLLAEHHAAFGIPLYTEHFFPVLFHGFARGGWTAATKILKENWAPAYIACAMGAALQYGTELWITPDLWFINDYPGHDPDTYRSALLLAYHMGADTIYTENLAYDHEDAGRGSLIRAGEYAFAVTDHGRVAQWFRQEYVPTHPRRYSFRDLIPRVAIIRQEDACWGQARSWLPDRLFGSKTWRSTDTTEAWLRLWHVLSRGTIPGDSLSWHGGSNRGRDYQLFCPLEGVVVYDHHARKPLFDKAELICLTGLGISEPTLRDVAECVEEGATCVALAHLAPDEVREASGGAGIVEVGGGRWVVVQDFLDPLAVEAIVPVLPAGKAIRYRFGDVMVRFEPVDDDPNRLEVSFP